MSKPCSKCGINEACPNHAYCRPCQRIYEDARRTKPKKFIRRPNSDSDMCPRCGIRPRLPYHKYCKECKNESHKEWRNKQGSIWQYLINSGRRDQGLAHAAVSRVVKSGKLIKPNTCSKCGESFPKRLIEGHHHLGYSKENWLDVMWLCPKCHDKDDKRISQKVVDKL